MHTGPVPGSYTSAWKKEEYVCYKCKTDNLYFKEWDSSCGGYTDYQYECRNCGHKWWAESPDA